ncbi:hypothetical protein [uncultured Sphingobacterium sp.]|uniref:hypothetical protein n=1 Tax=uncultured Sphingobacterium sp. TaxID=182688 RepID=UPI003748F9F0
MNKRKIAILLEFGFHEVKKYIYSGFADTLSKEFDIIWVALDKGSIEFHNCFAKTGFPIVYVQENDVIARPLRIEKFNRSVRNNWIINNNVGGFHNHIRIKKKSIKTRLVGNTFFKDILGYLTLRYSAQRYQNEVLRNIFSLHDVSGLLITGTSSYFVKSAVMTAQTEKIPVNYLVNSWKDLYINNFIPFKNLSNIFVWSERMKSDYLKHMPYLNESNFVISGNPTFDSLLRSDAKDDRSFYSEKYKIPLYSKWLLYTMMPVGLAKDELETIIYTANNVLKYFSKDEYTIIVRKNPTHAADDFKDTKLPDNLILADHYCSFDKKNDMIIQSSEGEQEWLDLVHHSIANLSVPSTVTLEFLILGKNVFNISYNSRGEVDERLSQFFNAGFYRPLFERNDVINVESPEELVENLKKLGVGNKSRKLSHVTAGEVIVRQLAKI